MKQQPQPELDPSPSDPFAELLKGSLVPTLIVSALCVVVALFFGAMQAWSALFGSVLVMVFFGAGLAVMKVTTHMAPTAVMGLVMLSYTAKVLLLGVALWLVKDASWLSGYATGVTITVCTLIWLFFEMRSYLRLRIFVFEAPVDAGPV